MAEEETTAYHPRCMNLSCKSMLVFGGAFESDPDFQAGLTEFWCVRTMKGQGPDGEEVSLTLCSNAERTCFQEY